MKLQINNRLRIVLISILIILIATSSFGLFQKVYKPIIVEEKKPVYTYNNKASVGYTVFLKANNLYEGNSLDEGKLYITEFVDYIRTSFNYEFTGERDADIKGTYDIVAKVQGFTGDGESLKSIWEKEYVILKKQNFNIEGTSKTIKEEVKLKLDPYNSFVEEIKESSKISSQTMVTLSMNINIEGSTNKGPIEDSISPSLIIPLDTPMFEIGGNNTIDRPGVIEETIKLEIPIDSKEVIFHGIIIGILILILIGLISFVKVAPNKDAHEKLLGVIFKKHGDRLVALDSELITDGMNTINVKTVDDLVRIADEVSRPILYKHSGNYKDIDALYIFDKDHLYVLNLRKTLLIYEENVEINHSL